MPILTIEALRENPINVIAHDLPEAPTQLLLELAYLAADCRRKSEYLLMIAARETNYIPHGWEPTCDSPDIHEESEARCHEADLRLDEICDLLENEFGRWLKR
jgi:hypothetical protein